MSTTSDARDALRAACESVPGLAVFGLGDSARTPGAVVGPARLQAQGGRWADPTDATFVVTIVTDASRSADDRLYDLVTAVASAIEANTPATVSEANPTAYQDGATQLPGYDLTVEYPL